MLIRFRKSDGTEYPQWEEHIVESQIEELSLKTTINNEYPILSSTHSGIKLQNEYFNKQTASEDNVGYKIVPYGYFTYRAMSDTGKFVFNQQTLLDKGIVSPAYPVFKVIESNADYFRYFMNESKDIKSQILILKEGSTRFALPASKLKKLKIKLPCIEEQQKIANFLSTVDQKIEAQKSIVADYEELKKGTMQKIFNQENRFKDDDGNEFPEWETLTLKDVFKEVSNKNHPELPVLSVAQGIGTVLRDESERRIMYDKSKLAGYKEVNKNDFIVHLRTFEGGLECSNHNGITSPAYRILRTDLLIADTFKYYFRSKQFIEQKLAIAVTGIRDGKNIDMPSFYEIQINVPCIEEQKKIADCLSALDRKIEAEKKILADLEELKKGLLQGIFNN